RIATPGGERAIEDLKAGDLVMTLDHGPQPLRWVGSRRVAAIGKLAPVEIAAGVLGNRRPLRVSPQHRMLVGGWAVELAAGTAEAFATARHLVDGRSIRTVTGGEVEYFHLLLDRHEVILAEGAASESFHPGPQGMQAMTLEARAEIRALFPDIARDAGQGYGPLARPMLTQAEARLVATRLAAPYGAGRTAVAAC